MGSRPMDFAYSRAHAPLALGLLLFVHSIYYPS